MSTNPGVTSNPVASISRRPGPISASGPRAVTTSPSMAMLQFGRGSAPVPSTTSPLRMTRSCMVASLSRRPRSGPAGGTARTVGHGQPPRDHHGDHRHHHRRRSDGRARHATRRGPSSTALTGRRCSCSSTHPASGRQPTSSRRSWPPRATSWSPPTSTIVRVDSSTRSTPRRPTARPRRRWCGDGSPR